jgi:LPXTG-motif cell wall-anchored protein
VRSRITAGVLLSLALLVPAAPAAAHTASPGLNEACQTVERKVYKDIRQLVTIDLDTASNIKVRLLANQIMAAAKANSLTNLPGRMQERLDGTADDLRAFLKTTVWTVWSTDLRLAVDQTTTGAGANVKAAAQTTLDEGTIDALLAYLNDGLYVARARDCASQSASPASALTSPSPSPCPSPSVSASASHGTATTTAPTTAASTGSTATSPATVPATTTASSTPASGSMPVTGTKTGVIAAIGGAFLFLGGASVLLARRRRTAAGE